MTEELAVNWASQLAQTYKEQILHHHEVFGRRAAADFLRTGFELIKVGRETGQLILAAKSSLKPDEFKFATDFLSDQAIKGYCRFVKAVELINESKASLSEVMPAAGVAAMLAGAVPMPSGHGPQQLHESNFHSRFIKLTQTLMGDVNQELKDHPLEALRKDQLVSMAAATEPIAQLHERIQSLIG